MSIIKEMRGPYPEYQKIRDAARNPRALEYGSFTAPDREGRPRGATESQERGLHAIDEYVNKGGLRSDAADRLDDLIRNHDRLGLEGRYLDAVGNPAYNSASASCSPTPSPGTCASRTTRRRRCASSPRRCRCAG